MAVDELRVNYGGIAASRQILLEQKEVFDNCYAKMKHTVENLPEYWSGDTAISYGDQFENLTSNFTNVSDLIQALSEQLQNISGGFSDTDSGIAQQVKVQ